MRNADERVGNACPYIWILKASHAFFRICSALRPRCSSPNYWQRRGWWAWNARDCTRFTRLSKFISGLMRTQRLSCLITSRSSIRATASSMMGIASPNVTGVVTAFFRPPPYNQISSGALQDIVDGREFAGQRALVIGGSRGLGEVTAKLLSAGGADVKLTYHQGAADARRVVAEITSSGGHAGCVPLDVLDHAASIDDVLDRQWTPTHLYYLASPFIARGRNGGILRAVVSDVLQLLRSWLFASLSAVVLPRVEAGALPFHRVH